ncbi:MAG: hypothetical protein KKB20_22435 [Proteobacteria bacterium]|nr:hypothetical protein [Pseudomonadota bacterium]
MDDYWEETGPGLLDRLDIVIDVAYFVPLSVRDALAVQFRNQALRGLPIETVARVFALMDDMEVEPRDEVEPHPVRIAGVFFTRLREEMPGLFETWSGQDLDAVLDPVGAFQLVLKRGETEIEAWLESAPERIDPSTLALTRGQGRAALMNDFDARALPDDLALRRFLREAGLAPWPAWSRPGLYLDCWAEFVRAVMDISPRPETRRRWPW